MSPRNYRETFPIHYEAGKSINDIASFHMNAKGIQAVKRAISKGKDPNQKDEEGRMALYIAIKRCNYDIAKYLGSRPEVNIHLKDKEGNSALDWAILHIALQINVRSSLKEIKSEWFLKDWIEIIRVLIFRGADTEAYFVRDTDAVDAAEKEKTIKDRIKRKLPEHESLDQVVSKAIYPSIQSIIRSAFQDIETVYNKYDLPSREAARNFAFMSKKEQKVFLQGRVELGKNGILLPEIQDMIMDYCLPTFFLKPLRNVLSQDLSVLDEHNRDLRQASP